jgi:hypothetical protein
MQGSRSAVVAANIIKFGAPLGIVLASGRIVSAYFFSANGVTSEDISFSIFVFFLGLVFGAVLGSIRNRL